MKKLFILLFMLLLWFSSTALASSAPMQSNFPCYGSQTEGAILLEITNMTGHTIHGLFIRNEAQETFSPENVPLELLGGDVIMPKDTIGMWCQADSQSPQNALWEITFLLDHDLILTLHHVDAADIDQAALFFSDGVAHLTYISKSTGNSVSTLLSELRILSEKLISRDPLPFWDGIEVDSTRRDIAS